MVVAISRIPISTSFDPKHPHFDVCEINGSKFALFSKTLRSSENLCIDLSDHHVIFLAPQYAKNIIRVNAISMIALTTLNAEEGEIQINANGKCVLLGGKMNSRHTKLVVSNQVFAISVLEERLDMILGMFNEGILNSRGFTILEALMETFDAIEDPEWKKKSIDTLKAFQFFGLCSRGQSIH